MDGAGLAIEVAEADQLVPSGWALRRLLMHVCDKAVRTESAVLEMGADAAALAAEAGLPATEPVLQELTTQLERLAAARLSLSWDKDQALAVFDARGQRRRPGTEWRSRIRLSSRFHASLMEHAIPLDREIVGTLAAESLALDAHGWIRYVLHNQPAGQTTTVPWPDLLRRFGGPGQEPQAFRASFEDALRMVFAADYSISLAADDEGVTVGSFVPEAEPAPEARPSREEPAAPAPVPPPAAAPRPAPPAASPPPGRSPAAGDEASRAPRRVEANAAPAPAPAVRNTPQPIGLGPHLTGLPGVIWLRRGGSDEPVVIAVTPSMRPEPNRMTTLMLEPLVMQISGGLYQDEFTKVSSWIMANRDLIDLVWEGEIKTLEEASSRVRKAPAPGWR
ncbi:replication initiation protein [Teichococcus wenyumeiae]|nr:replication protein RepA [Pseudoroseomonas wenyumeiae]